MKLSELRQWVDKLPKEFDEFEVILAQIGKVDEEYWFRKDEEIIALNVDVENGEVLIMRGSDETDEQIKKEIK